MSPSTEKRLGELCQKYQTIQSFTVAFHPDNSERFASYPERCLFGTSPTLTDLRLAYDGKADIQWLVVQLSTFQEKVNVETKMTKYQLEACAQTISCYFGYLKATEIMLFLSRLQGGAYTVDWYGSISPDKIVTALREQFMPWRNHQFYLMEREQAERKNEEMAEEQGKMTFEQWAKMKHEKGEKVLNEENPIGALLGIDTF